MNERKNIAKSNYNRTNHKKRNHKRDKNNKVSKRIGLIFCTLQGVASIYFLGALWKLNMLPMKYIGCMALALLIFLALPLIQQLTSNKKAIAGKVFSIIMTVVLIMGGFYIFETANAVEQISSGSEVKYDRMVVSVLADDPAESIVDASDYNFAVQYNLNGDDVKQAVAMIEDELGTTITVTEYAGVAEQAIALYAGEVDAMIYNEGYEGVIEEEYNSFSSDVKTIYTHDIEKEIVNTASEVVVEDEAFIVYISGIDVYGDISKNSRSDVNILAVVDPVEHQILLVTTPRDYYVTFPGVTGEAKDKLTHAGIYGVDVSEATLENVYNIDIDFYARVNFTSLEVMVDALGGVDVYSNQSFQSYNDSSFYVNEGMNTFNGYQALLFARERYNIEGGDYQRGINQQEVIKAMLKKALSPAMLSGASEILSAVSSNVDTNMTTEQIQELVKTQIDEGASWSLKMVAAEGTGDRQMCYSYSGGTLYVSIPVQESVDAISEEINMVLNGELLEGAEPLI